MFTVKHPTADGTLVVGYFEEGLCRKLVNGEWIAPHCSWWWGRWEKVCVGPLEMHTGQWEHDELATEEYVRLVGRTVVA